MKKSKQNAKVKAPSIQQAHGFRLVLLGLAVLLSLRFAPEAHALPAPIQVAPGKVTYPIRSGVVTGGKAVADFSLLDVKTFDSEGGETLTLSYGDRLGKVLKGETGYFHVALDRDSRRIVIDLAQVNRTAVEPKQLQKIFASSKLVSGTDMTMDPHDGSTNITLTLKAPVEIKVAAESSNQGQLVIHMREITSEQAGRQ